MRRGARVVRGFGLRAVGVVEGEDFVVVKRNSPLYDEVAAELCAFVAYFLEDGNALRLTVLVVVVVVAVVLMVVNVLRRVDLVK